MPVDAPITDVYTTIFPFYAITQRILDGNNAYRVHCLIQPQDGCIRSYALSDWDLYTLGYDADIVIAGGQNLESDITSLESAAETDFILMEALEGIDLKDFTTDEIFSTESHFYGKNPHIYLSISGAKKVLGVISAMLCAIDFDNSAEIESQSEQANDELNIVAQFIFDASTATQGKRAAILNECCFYPAEDMNLDIVAVYLRESGEVLNEDMIQKCVAELISNKTEIALIEQQAPIELIDALESNGIQVAKINTLSTYTTGGWQYLLDILTDNAQSIVNAANRINETEIQN
ncbi:MAG: zinc ABC transporter substrate-binding protein [Clostridia bacterium]|nr:zinc ABC transporter substrate-binding protein [Clostridia bacterium]